MEIKASAAWMADPWLSSHQATRYNHDFGCHTLLLNPHWHSSHSSGRRINQSIQRARDLFTESKDYKDRENYIPFQSTTTRASTRLPESPDIAKSSSGELHLIVTCWVEHRCPRISRFWTRAGCVTGRDSILMGRLLFTKSLTYLLT